MANESLGLHHYEIPVARNRAPLPSNQFRRGLLDADDSVLVQAFRCLQSFHPPSSRHTPQLRVSPRPVNIGETFMYAPANSLVLKIERVRIF
jgi:hypothetical protein